MISTRSSDTDSKASDLGKMLTWPLSIGSQTYRNRVILAPMSGVSDVPFRRAAWRAGAGMVVSEMVASEALVTGHAEMQMKAEGAGLPVHVVQLAGRQVQWMDHAARIAEANGANVIDINMGCPARRVTQGYSGSALMQDLDHALTLIDAVVNAVKIPVTLKMRLGWDHGTINAPELARRAEDAGVQLLTVHGRTRCQFYKGAADWKAVRKVREATRLPMLVNGDIFNTKDAIEAISASGADGVMIGRASYGQPDLPGNMACELQNIHQANKYDIVDHYTEIIEFYGENLGVRCARKHIGWWMERQTFPIDGKLKREIMTAMISTPVIRHLEALNRQSVYHYKSTRNAA